MHEVQFTGKCPSRNQIKSALKKGLESNHWASVEWGENQIVAERHMSGLGGVFLVGTGWIRKNGGDDVVRELTKEGVR